MQLNQTKFAKLFEMRQSTYSGIERGRESFTDKNIKLISEVLEINEEWLRTGKGEMCKNEIIPTKKEMIKLINDLTEENQKIVQDYIKLVVANEKKMKSNKH